MNSDSNKLFFQLSALAQQWPTSLWSSYGKPEVKKLLAQASVLIETAGDISDYAKFITAVEGLSNPKSIIVERSLGTVETVFQRTLARAELNADAGDSTFFVPSGAEFSAAIAVNKIVAEAKTTVRFIDPYAGIEILAQFGILCAIGIKVEILTDKKLLKPTLSSSAVAWVQQHADERPLEIRQAKSKTLHDRAIFVDDERVWIIGQSFNALATRSATSMVPMHGEAADLKIEAYREIWASSEPLVC